MNTPKQNVINTLKGKKVLFLENSNSLEDGVDEFEKILKEAKIKYKVLLNVSEIPLDKIIKLINKYDGIVFMTTWTYEVSHKLQEYMFGLKDKKIVVEVFISEPSWYYKPKVVHDVYIYSFHESYSGEDERKYEEFYKLSRSKAYWDFKNGFTR